MVTYSQVQEELAKATVGFAIGLCPKDDCPDTNQMYEYMCQGFEGSSRYCTPENIAEDYERFGRSQVEVEFREDYRLYVPEESICEDALLDLGRKYQDIALFHSWMGMMVDPELEWAHHMRRVGEHHDECKAVFCTEFKTGKELRICTDENVDWVTLKYDFESTRIGESIGLGGKPARITLRERVCDEQPNLCGLEIDAEFERIGKQYVIDELAEITGYYTHPESCLFMEALAD